MLVEISKIRVSNRIRKDFGNIEELAADIKQNTLLNPVTVVPTPEGEYQLIAGERRLRACKLLGMNAISVNAIAVKDAEQALRIEIAENENRKEFSFSERMEWARRLEDIEKLKAKDRQGERSDLVENFPRSSEKTRDIVAEQTGFGSGKQYEKAKFVADHADEETIRQLDENKISVHAAYQKLRSDKEAAEAAKAAAESRASEAEEARLQLIKKHQQRQEELEAEIRLLQARPNISREDYEYTQMLQKENTQLHESIRIMQEEVTDRLAALDRDKVNLREIKKCLKTTNAHIMVELSQALMHFTSIPTNKEAADTINRFFKDVDKTLAEHKAHYQQLLQKNQIEVSEDVQSVVSRNTERVIIDADFRAGEES